MTRSPLVSLVALGVLASAVGGAGCSDRDRTQRADPPRDPERQRRVIEPPVGTVRALPPHAIRAGSVGPYKLGDKLSDLLEQLPSGPRMALFDIPGVVHRSLIRAEDGTVLIGGEPASTATYLAVVGSEVARTESGIHVGSTRDELVRTLGPLVVELDRARDPRVVMASGLPTARMVLDGDRISAIVIAGDGSALLPARTRQDAAPTGEPGCPRPASTETAFGTCLTGTGELATIVDGELNLRAPDSDKVIAAARIPGVLVFAAPLRALDGKDELVAVTQTNEATLRTWLLLTYRYEAGKLTRTADPLYQLSSANARWIGADLHEVELYLELTSRAEAIEVGGLLTTRPDSPTGGPASHTRDVVVISPVSVARRRTKPIVPEGPSSEPARDPAHDPIDAAVQAGGAHEATGSGADHAKP